MADCTYIAHDLRETNSKACQTKSCLLSLFQKQIYILSNAPVATNAPNATVVNAVSENLDKRKTYYARASVTNN